MYIVQRTNSGGAKVFPGRDSTMYESFEKTYPHYPFAELVGLGITLARLFTRDSEKQATTRLPSGTAPAAH